MAVWCMVGRWLNTWVWIVGGWLDEWLEVGWLVQADGWTHVLGLVNSSPFGCRLRRWRGWMACTLGLGKAHRLSVAGLGDGEVGWNPPWSL